MSSPAFTLHVPADADYPALASEVASRYVALLGGSEAECEALGRSLTEKMRDLAKGHEVIDVSCTARPAGIDFTITAGGRSTVIHHPLPAGTS